MVETGRYEKGSDQAGDWTAAEVARFVRRAGVFRQEGLSAGQAERLAEQMLHRDRPGSGDDRRVCFECKHLRPNARCRPGHMPLRFVLQRCDGFELKGA